MYPKQKCKQFHNMGEAQKEDLRHTRDAIYNTNELE